MSPEVPWAALAPGSVLPGCVSSDELLQVSETPAGKQVIPTWRGNKGGAVRGCAEDLQSFRFARCCLLCEQEKGSLPPAEAADDFCPGSSNQTRKGDIVLGCCVGSLVTLGPAYPRIHYPGKAGQSRLHFRKPRTASLDPGGLTAGEAQLRRCPRAPACRRIFRLRPALLSRLPTPGRRPRRHAPGRSQKAGPFPGPQAPSAAPQPPGPCRWPLPPPSAAE